MGGVVQLTKENFEEEVLKSSLPVLVDFWAPWCRPCLLIAPMMEELEKEMEGKIKFGKLNVGEGRSVALKYSVMSIPALILFKDGEAISSKVGARPKDDIKNWIEDELRETPSTF